MRLAILSNHSYPSVGGSERVLLEVANRMVGDFGHKVTVFSDSTLDTTTYNGVVYEPASKAFYSNDVKGLASIQPDHIFVYSDSFKHFRTLFFNSHKIKCRKSIALLGMYTMSRYGDLRRAFKEAVAKGEWTPVVHSYHGIEYEAAEKAGFAPLIIPNGVNLQEFKRQPDYFRNKYDIKTKYALLCVANFFPGKGQEYFVNVLKLLRKKRNDFTAVFVANHSNIKVVNDNMTKFGRFVETAGCEYRLLWDTPREDVVQAYFESDLFTFPSQKEVAPLVLLECQASKLPFVSMDVGNVFELNGGQQIMWRAEDARDFGQYDQTTYSDFANMIDNLLNNPDARKNLGDNGRKQVEEKFNWDVIANQYEDLFFGYEKYLPVEDKRMSP